MAPWAYAAGVVGLAVALCIGCAAQLLGFTPDLAGAG